MLNDNKKETEKIDDFRLVLSFTNAYQRLYEQGEITEEQLFQVSTLIDHYHKYTLKEFQDKLKEIFD